MPLNRETPTLEKALKTLFRMYFSNSERLWVPDHLHEIPGFDDRFDRWLKRSVMCSEPYTDIMRRGTWYCASDIGHLGQHWGGLSFENRSIGIADDFTRSLQQEARQ